MSHKVHMKQKTRVKAGQKFRNDPDNPMRWRCANCQRELPTARTLCRKLRNCPGRVRDRLTGKRRKRATRR